MANYLFCWELGGGLGHTTLVRPFAEGLLARGHRVLAAVREISAARRAFGEAGISYVPAPFATGPRTNPIRRPRFYGHILYNNGLGDAEELAGLLAAWRGLYEVFQPDVILFNHSPTALLAARGTKARRILLGDGFCSPPARRPLPIVRPWMRHDEERLVRDDELITATANRALKSLDIPNIACLGDIYADVNDNILLTLAELDHFGPREGAKYYGVFNTCDGAAPEWPSGGGPRVFGYLKAMPTMRQFLQALGELDCRAVIYGPWVRDYLKHHQSPPNVRLSIDPIDLSVAAGGCDAAILNATHGTTAAFLLAGKPILQLPIFVEQVLTARNTRSLGAGLIGKRTEPSETAGELDKLIHDESFSTAARAMERKYEDLSVSRRLADLIDVLDAAR